jgi:HSP20 family protein
MTLMRRSNPFGEFLSLRQAMDRLFEESFIRPRSVFTGDGDGEFGIPLDVSSTTDALVIEAALPGVKPEDVEVSLLGDTLTINGSSSTERESEESGYMYREVRRGRFSRTVTLPSAVDTDKAVATFENGMLRLTIPKAEAAKPRQIHVAIGGDARSVGVGSGAASQSVGPGEPAESSGARPTQAGQEGA